MIQTQENGEKPHFGPDLDPLSSNSKTKTSSSDIVPIYHPMKFKEKLVNQTCENRKKPNSGPNFGPFGPNLDLNYFFGFHFY